MVAEGLNILARIPERRLNVSEWLDEPNREEFEHAGLKCLIIRHPELGHLCGYLAVKRGHPCYGKFYDYLPYEDLFPVDVHGGLTFSQEGDGKEYPKGYWWLGFDCAHAYDIVPFMPSALSQHGSYKNFNYVRQEIKKLVAQVKTLDFIDWQFKWVWPLFLPVRIAHRRWSRYSPKNTS